MKPPVPLSKNPALVIALGWYQPQQWPRLRAISADRQDLDAAYPQWLAKAQAQLTQLEAAGHRVEKVPIDVETLRRWCKRRNRPVDANARAAYAAERLHRRPSGDVSGAH